MTLRLRLLLALAMLTSCSGHGGDSSKTVTPDPSPRSQQIDIRVVQDFVQEFYSWYVPVAAKSRSGRASDLALSSLASAFESSLVRQLKEDSDAQAKVSGDIVGLDFDPFLAAQDPCQRYEV